MKRPDVRQAWREKLALNLLIWFCCGISIFIIAVLGLVICPAEHVFSQGELSSHDSTASEVYTSIRGEVFDLAIVSANHLRTVSVVPTKSILEYGGTSADDIFPVQVWSPPNVLFHHSHISYIRSVPSAMVSMELSALLSLSQPQTFPIPTQHTIISF